MVMRVSHKHEIQGSTPCASNVFTECGIMVMRMLDTHKILSSILSTPNGPVDYQLGHKVLNLVKGGQHSLGLMGLTPLSSNG